jgi:hypothetical protein
MTEKEYRDMVNENGGFCTKCHCEHYGIEPDAIKYHCEDCNNNAVYGIEELLVMGQVDIIDEVSGPIEIYDEEQYE